MVTLLGDVHLWTLRDDVIVKDADVGAFRYQDKNTVSRERVYYEDKRQYMEARGVVVTPKNSRPLKLRDSLREFEELLARERVVWEAWKSPVLYQLIFTSGIIVTLTVSAQTGDLTKIVFDKFLMGKLLSEHLADVVMTKQHMLFSYNECRLSVVHLTRSPPEGQVIEKLSALDPKLHTCEVAGPSGRRFERKLSANLSGDMVVVWWQTSEDEVYPWSPLAKDRDRANILVYALRGTSLDLVCYCRTEMAPLSVSFSRVQPNVLLTVEQGFGKKGGVTVLSCVYEVDRGALHRITVTTIPLEAPLMTHSHNPAEDRLLLACNNGVLALHSDCRGMTHVTKAGLIPSSISWLDSGNLVMVSNERGQIQCFDLALSLIRLQLVMEDPNPQRILDFSEHFCHQPCLARLGWAPGRDPDDPRLLLLHYARGPIACMRLDMSAANKGGLSVPALVCQYVKYRQVDEAVNLLVSLNWDQEGPVAMQCLTTIVNHLLKKHFTPQREAQLEAALGSFHVPVQPLSQAVEEEFGPAVRALTVRFFHKVLRCGRLEKAYRLALDLKHYGCFMATYTRAWRIGNSQVAAAALENARSLDPSSGSCNSIFDGYTDSESSDSCSESCSTCFSESPIVGDSDEARERGGESRGDECASVQPEVNMESSPQSSPNPLPHMTEGMKYVSLGGGVTPPATPQTPSSYPTTDALHGSHSADIPYGPHTSGTPHTSGIPHSPHTSAITSQDGTITINIRQHDTASQRSSTYQGGAASALPRPPAQQTTSARVGGSGRGPRTVREVFYSSDPNEEFVDSETVSVFLDKKELRSDYERAVYHEVSTEEEDGGTVKVVHFGVV